MYPSPWSHPVASSSSWSGVHIQVTAGSPFTSSHTGSSSTTAESTSMRPRREAGVRGSGLWTRGTSLAPSPEPPAPERSRLTEILRVDMRPLLHAHRVQRDPARQAGCDALPHVHRQRLPRREPAARSELGERLVDAAAVEPPGDFVRHQPIARIETNSPTCFRHNRPSYRAPA